MTKIIIAGRTCTGKTTLATALAAATGMTVLKTCTNRPRRTPDEDTYHFYTEDEATTVPAEQKMFYTKSLDGYERWTNEQDLLNADIAILDFNGIEQAAELYKAHGHMIMMIYVWAHDKHRLEVALQVALRDGKSINKAERAYKTRNKMESEMFTKAELKMNRIAWAGDARSGLITKRNTKSQVQPSSLFGEDILWSFSNDFEEKSMRLVVDLIKQELMAHPQNTRWTCHKVNAATPFVMEPGDCVKEKWDMICDLLGIPADQANRIAINITDAKYYTKE